MAASDWPRRSTLLKDADRQFQAPPTGPFVGSRFHPMAIESPPPRHKKKVAVAETHASRSAI